MAEAEAQDEYFYKGTAEEELERSKILALPDEWLGTWTQRKENGVDNFDEYLLASGLGMIKRGLIKAVAKNNFQFVLANESADGEVKDGYYFEAKKPRSVKTNIPLGNVKTQVKLPKGLVDMWSYFVDGSLVCINYHDKAKKYEKTTRTIKDGVMTHFVEMITCKTINSAKEKGEEPKHEASHTRFLIKENAEK